MRSPARYSGFSVHTTTVSGEPDTSMGTHRRLEIEVYKHKILEDLYIRFDLGAAGIPAGSLVKKATLTLWVSRSNNTEDGFVLRKMTQAWDNSLTYNTAKSLTSTEVRFVVTPEL